jgi:transposase
MSMNNLTNVICHGGQNMRGKTDSQNTMFVMINVEASIPKDHPLRPVKQRCEKVLKNMSNDFTGAYSKTGRPGIPPEQLLKALLLQALYSIRSEIQLMQAIQFNLLYRWFLDIPGDRDAWTPEVFSVNRERFAEHGLVRKFFDAIIADAITEQLISSDHFTADGTLIRSWASLKSLKPKEQEDNFDEGSGKAGRNPDVDWHGHNRGNATHISKTDPEALLARKGKGKEAHLCHSGHIIMENRNGLCIDVAVDCADGKAERRSASVMLRRIRRRHRVKPKTVGFDAGYDDGRFLRSLERQHIIPHVPLRNERIVSVDEFAHARRRAKQRRKTKGYRISQRIRKRAEEIIGWMKTVGGLARARFVGRWKIEQQILVAAGAYNLLRIARLEMVT